VSPSETLISVTNVSCELGGTRILNGVDLQLSRGEITVVLGSSGAGKSTLLRVIAGLEPVSAGEISSPEGVISSASRTVPPELRRLGFVVQNYALFPHLTALDNVRFGLDRSAPPNVATNWLERVNLLSRADAYPHELSGGEQQRIALARALAREPDIVLLDEAFSSLDRQLRRSVRSEAKQLLRGSGAAVLAVTHDPDEALELADRIMVMSEGSVLQEGTPDELYWRPQSITAARLLGDVSELKGRVSERVFESAFGSIALPSDMVDNHGLALVRPLSATASDDPGGLAAVVETEFTGGARIVTLESENGEFLRVSEDFGDNLKIGTRVRIEFDENRIGWARDRQSAP